MKKRTEIIDGRVYEVTELPEANPPAKRSAKTRYHMEDVGKPGDLPWSKSRSEREARRKKKR